MHGDNHTKAIVQAMLARQGMTRWGTVSSVNPADMTVKVMFQPENEESGWLPFAFTAAGSVNIIALPSIGDQVLIHPDTGDAEHGIVSAACHSTQQAPPTSPITGNPPQSGEVYINCGSVYFHITGGKIYMGGGDLVVAGSITATGNITAGRGGSDAVDLLNHTHQYIPGSGTATQTNAPTAGT
jgi:phage baseplate assembly protein gpV